MIYLKRRKVPSLVKMPPYMGKISEHIMTYPRQSNLEKIIKPITHENKKLPLLKTPNYSLFEGLSSLLDPFGLFSTESWITNALKVFCLIILFL